MPRAFLTLMGAVTGYLNGAGLGALLLSFYPSTSTLPDLKLVMASALILGPIGTLIGLFVVHKRAPDVASGGLPDKK